jgi:hypothetical protein
MILDEKLELADAVSVALTAGATPQNIGDIIDLGTARDLGGDRALYLVITVDTEVITAGATGAMEFMLVSDGTDTIATDGSQSIHYVSEAFVTDDAAANDVRLSAGATPVIVQLPAEGVPYERYLALQVLCLTTNTTAGKINAFLTTDVARWRSYDAPFQL